MKVGFVHDREQLFPLPAGGKERFVFNLAQELSTRQEITDVTVLTLTAAFEEHSRRINDKLAALTASGRRAHPYPSSDAAPKCSSSVLVAVSSPKI